MKKINTIAGQNLFDIALEQYGQVEGIIFLLEDNPLLTLAADLLPGQEVLVREEEVPADEGATPVLPVDITTLGKLEDVYTQIVFDFPEGTIGEQEITIGDLQKGTYDTIIIHGDATAVLKKNNIAMVLPDDLALNNTLRCTIVKADYKTDVKVELKGRFSE